MPLLSWLLKSRFRTGETSLQVGGVDHLVRVWDVVGGGSRVLEGHRYAITCLALDREGKYALSSSRDNTVRIWNLTSGKCRANDGHVGAEHGRHDPDGGRRDLERAFGDRPAHRLEDVGRLVFRHRSADHDALGIEGVHDADSEVRERCLRA